MSLADKIRKARETSIDVGQYKFQIRRPTDLEATGMTYDNLRDGVMGVSKFVIGWDLKEIDLIAGGAPDPVEFHVELFSEWIKDRPDLWQPLTKGVLGAYQAHRARMEAQGNA